MIAFYVINGFKTMLFKNIIYGTTKTVVTD